MKQSSFNILNLYLLFVKLALPWEILCEVTVLLRLHSLRANPARGPRQVKLDSDKGKLWKNRYVWINWFFFNLAFGQVCKDWLHLLVMSSQATSNDQSSLWKESLNSEGQQFNQYQQIKQPPLVSNHWT